MTGLAAFLTERITEDEQIAQAAIDNGEGCLDWADAGDPTDVHIARWDPARVLAECEAKRRIVEIHARQGGVEYWMTDDWVADMDDSERAGYCGRCERNHDAERWPCETLRALAEVYRDHPDFDPAWLS